MGVMRELNPLIEEYIDGRIAPYESTDSPHAILLKALHSMVGIQEEGGNNRGALVSAIQDTVGAADAWAWCLSLQQTAIAYVEKKLQVVCDVLPHEHCLTLFNDAKKRKKIVNEPIPGDLIIWQHGATTSGHVGCVIEAGPQLLCIEGNTAADSGTVVRDGDGVFLKKRSRLGAGSMRVLGFVRLGFSAGRAPK